MNKIWNYRRLGLLAVFQGLILAVGEIACDAQITIGTTPTFWLRADDAPSLTISSGLVQSWNNQESGGSVVPSVSNNSASTEPSFLASDPTTGKPAVVFNGTTTFLDNTSVTGSSLFGGTDSTIFIVQMQNADDNGNSFNWHAGTPATYLSMNAANSGSIVFDSGNSSDFLSASIPSGWYGNWHVITGVRNGTTGEIHVDGQNLTTTGSFSGSANTSTPGSLSIGGLRGSGTSSLNGSIAEILVFGSALSPSDISTVEGELGSKYGISVVPEPEAYATAFAGACLVIGLVAKLRRRQAA